MSNDTDFSIKLRGKITDVDAAVKYMEVKKTRWDYYKRTYMENPAAVLKKELGEESAGAVVCWGIDFDSVKYHKDGRLASVKGASWANENGFGNVWISGPEGELAALAKKIPDRQIKAKFKDEYGNGYCEPDDFTKVYTGYREWVTQQAKSGERVGWARHL